MSDECSVSELGACYWCEKVQKERDEARALARELRDLLAAFPTVSLRGIDDTYPWITEKETP